MTTVSLISKPKANGDVVDMLERWLTMAREGQLSSVAIVGVKTERRVEMSHVTAERGVEQMALCGALHECARDIGAMR